MTNTSRDGEPLPHRPADLNPNATEYHANNRSPQSDPGNEMKSYVNFMARRELIANKIEKFDDNPVNYHTWKASFKNMIRNVGITPSEEFSLLVEYTTLTSKSLVQRLRNAYIGKPHEGITEIWKRLDEWYGCSSVLVKAHLEKLSSVPKINYKDNRTLREFSDLLLELNCAKKDGVLTGLRVLDEPIYLKPVIAKLPGDVQGRWQRHAFRFMNDKQVPYPPFNEFAHFIGEVSREKNEPNLCLSPPEDNLNLENSRAKPRRAYKTGLAGAQPPFDRKSLDPGQWCVVHRKSHPINQCCVFRAKPIEERRALLKQHNICYRCVASNSHMAKNCKAAIKCSKCQSDKHTSALHVGVPPEHDSQWR